MVNDMRIINLIYQIKYFKSKGKFFGIKKTILFDRIVFFFWVLYVLFTEAGGSAVYNLTKDNLQNRA